MESQSIFDNENTRLSLFDADAISGVAPSELDFDFDGLVLNSQAYRRAFARAQSTADLETQAHVTEDISLPLSDGSTIRRVNRDLVDLNLATAVESSSLRRDCGETIRMKFVRLKDDPRTQICEKDCFRRLDQLHHKCEQGLEDAYAKSGHKYLVEHFTDEISLTDIDADTGSQEADFLYREENNAQVYGE
ncbi:hypothetical protein CDV36_011171 [Fusarium kuroshium]|uniref:Uncharacterized protein n=1 Tax=Fusarium kuroshium TaxID=2010991 RepID=A0A3M2RV76_9HYPO|nr:hypothetical protein CDV36_011171 [Fusarium kuroshium]